jgi:hypothetical protein
MIDSFKILRLDYTMLQFNPTQGYEGVITPTLYNLPMDIRNVIDFDFLQPKQVLTPPLSAPYSRCLRC